MTDEGHDRHLDPEQGGGPPTGTAWTLEIAGEGRPLADLEHAAPLPRVGELIELIQADGSRRYFEVQQVVHVLQPSASERPTVREESAGPNTVLRDAGDGNSGVLRAGLPRVVAAPIDPSSTPLAEIPE